MLLTIKCLSTSFGLVIGYLYGETLFCLQLLLLFMIADYLTGVLAAFSTQQLSSQIGFKGIARKIVLLIIVVLAHQLDLFFGDKNMLRDATLCFYIGNEMISLLENASRMDILIPDKLKKALQQFIHQEKEEEEND